MSPQRCFSQPPPGVELEKLSGPLVVIEGPDSSGRSTQVEALAEWLEQQGYAVKRAGLKRSFLVGPELEEAQKGNVLSPRTMSLFYATDFYDQLENRIVPALRAGYVVLADRYIFTLMARDLVRGAEPDWVESLYSRALVPDAIFYLSVSPRVLVERTLMAHRALDYWESGMDLGLSRDWMDSLIIYQRRIRAEFRQLAAAYGFQPINANRSIRAVQADLRGQMQKVLMAFGGMGNEREAQRTDSQNTQTGRPEKGTRARRRTPGAHHAARTARPSRGRSTAHRSP